MSGTARLLVDAGNSRIKWSMIAEDGATLGSGAFEHAAQALAPDWQGLPQPLDAWISNVAGDAAGQRIDAIIDARWPGLPRTTVRAQARQCGVTNCYAEPSALGSDRWCGLIGAHTAFPGENLLIATFGTATTLEALRADGTFTGGLIAPGWSLMMHSLGTHTAQLPTLDAAAARRELDNGFDRSRSVFANDTRGAVSAGCLLAQAGLIERAWEDLHADWRSDVRLVLGGGAASEIAGALSVPHTRHDSLVLAGLALIARDAAERNLS